MRHSIAKILAVTVMSTAVLAATSAYAGYKIAWPVYIVKNTDGSGWAYGSTAAARSSADTNQEVRCDVTWSSASCAMWDASNNMLTCQTVDPVMMAAARTFTTDSGLQIRVDATGTCTGIYVYNWSSFAPKAP